MARTASWGTPRELEALYRFLNNDRAKPEPVLVGHYEATAERAKSAGQVLIIHDTAGNQRAKIR